MHAPDYDHFYIPFFSKKGKFHPQTNIFRENNSPFSTEPAIVWVKISDFFGLRSRYGRLANQKKLILPLEKYLNTLKDMIICTESFTKFQCG